MRMHFRSSGTLTFLQRCRLKAVQRNVSSVAGKIHLHLFPCEKEKPLQVIESDSLEWLLEAAHRRFPPSQPLDKGSMSCYSCEISPIQVRDCCRSPARYFS